MDRSTDVEIIYSDSAVVKAKLITPVLLHYKGVNKPYYEMPKGVKVIFFDENHQEESNIVADYAISRETEKLVELRKNVVATNREGSTFKSDELFWDETKRRFYSNKTVTITSPNQTIYGTSFWANENFSYYEIKQSTGTLNVPEQELGTDSQAVTPAVQP
ncbi:LPS export ABC transporter periplasmic protein LptC (plasmid) [Pedobacter sp. BS3]|nr:LPS export ABC transporter periplasmic protein LptC [Pedobacter sp. BS3]